MTWTMALKHCPNSARSWKWNSLGSVLIIRRWSIFVGNDCLGAYAVAQSPDTLDCRYWKPGSVMTKCEAGTSLKSCAPLLESGDQPQHEFHKTDGGGIPGQESWQSLTNDKGNIMFLNLIGT